MSCKSIDIEEIKKIGDMGDFLRQNVDQSSPGEQQQEKDQPHDPDSLHEPETKAAATHGTDRAIYRERDEYVCENADCPHQNEREAIEEIHLFEINSNEIHTICSTCYDRGYRLCLISHEVYPQRDMHRIGDEQYVYSQYIIGKESHTLDMYGIENPDPTHYVVDLTETEN